MEQVLDYLAAIYALAIHVDEWLPVLAAGVLVSSLTLWALWLNLSQLRSRSRR